MTDQKQQREPASWRRAAVVFNPIKVDLEKLRSAVAHMEAITGRPASLWLETREDEPGTEMAQTAVDKGVDVVLACGGDGTVRAVAAALRGTGIALGIIASGTGNLLARNLQLPLNDVDAAVRISLAGKDREIDIGVVKLTRPDNSEQSLAFVVMAGLGLDAAMTAGADDSLKKKVGWLAYIRPIVEAMWDPVRVTLTYQIDGGEIRRAIIHTLLVGNCGTLPGNVVLLPDAQVDDAELDVVALRPTGLVGWARIAYAVLVENAILHRSGAGLKLRNRFGTFRALTYRRARTIEVHLEEPQEFEVDGDHAGEVSSFTAHIAPGELVVRVPKNS